MLYALRIGLRYLRSTRHGTISVITFIAVTGVALGVAALLTVQAITSGFQKEFRDKVLGVNAHVLVLKYGLDFHEYRDVIAMAEPMPEVTGAAPFLINEMMLAKEDRLSGVLVKGVDPDRLGQVLDLPDQLVQGGLEGLRLPGAQPPRDPERDARPIAGDDLDEVLRDLLDGEPASGDAGGEAPGDPDEAPSRHRPAWEAPDGADGRLPEVAVPSAEEVERLLGAMDDDAGMPTDEWEAQAAAEGGPDGAGDGDRTLSGIVVGATLAEGLGIGVGDRVKVISPLTGLDVSMWAPEARVPRSRDFRVIGVFEAGFQEYDSRLVYVDLYEAQRFHEHGDAVTGVEMRVRDIDGARGVARTLERKLAGPFHTMDWSELNHNLFTALEIQKIMLSLVIASIIIVAAFNVIATLIMVVLEKKREIAILKAMGATDGAVLLVFLVQGAVIGVVGTAIGLVLGGGLVAYLTAYEFPLDPKVYLIDHLPLVVSPAVFVVTSLVALGICLAATLIPSWWAARMLPADGVRYE
jgi:lipoprotein-releasing system permease protein